MLVYIMPCSESSTCHKEVEKTRQKSLTVAQGAIRCLLEAEKRSQTWLCGGAGDSMWAVGGAAGGPGVGAMGP